MSPEQRSNLISMISYGATLAAVVLAVIAILYLLPQELIPITSNVMLELKLICAFSLLSSALAVFGFWISPSTPQTTNRSKVAEVLLHISMISFVISVIGLMFLIFLLPFPITPSNDPTTEVANLLWIIT